MTWLLERKWLHRNLELSEATLVREGPSLDTIARYRLASKTEQNAISELTRGLNLQRRDLRYADLFKVRLDKADLRGSKLQGVDLEEAQLQGADLRFAKIWNTTPPDGSDLEHAKPMETASIARLEERAMSKLEKLIVEIEDVTLQKTLRGQLGSLLDNDVAQNWENTDDHDAWIRFSEQSKSDPVALSKFLGRLACEDRTHGYIVKPIARRIIEAPEDYGALVANRLVDK